MNKQRHLPRVKPSSFRPRLEQLEARDCPSCTVFQRGDMLYILGDRTGNQIEIAPAREGGINVTCDVGDPHRYTGVNKIDLKTFGGDDAVSFVCPSDPSFQFRADLGAGNDRLSIRGFDPQPDPPQVALFYDLHGGAGNDSFDLDILIPPDQQRQEVEWDMHIDLGAGHDRLAVNVLIPPDQQREDVTWDMHVAMGAGNDHYDLNVAIPPDQQRLEGAWDMRTDLGAGDDEFMMNLGDADLAGEFMMSVEGGAGHDVFNSFIVPCILPSGRANFDFNGGSGDDQFMMNLGEGEIAGQFVMSALGGAGNDTSELFIVPCLLPEGNASFRFDGEAGDDQLRMNVGDGEIGGQFVMSALGGSGNDIIESFIVPCVLPAGRGNFLFDGESGNDRIHVQVQLDEDDTGQLDVRVFGGLGNDNLKLALYDIPEAVLLTALLDGGRGHDVARITRNVRFANCEDVFFLDDPR